MREMQLKITNTNPTSKPTMGGRGNCQTPTLVLGLGVDFTFPNNKKNKKENPHLIFYRPVCSIGLELVTKT